MVNSGNGHGNGHQDKEPDTETTYTPLEDGYYLANLKDKQYYYCGEKEADVRIKLQSLGISTHDPLR